MMQFTKGVALAVTLGAVVWGGSAHACTMRLSELDAAAQALNDDIGEMQARLADLFARFDAMSDEEAGNPGTCPAGLEQSRAAALGLEPGVVRARSETLSECAFFFNQRILSDMADAQAADDSQLLLTLSEIQRRVFRVDEAVVNASRQALFVEFRAEALVAEHDTISRRCAMLGSIYE